MKNDFALVQEIKGQPVTTSRKVAEVFDKRHDNVLRDIQKLDCSEGFFVLNFEEKKYKSKRAFNCVCPVGGKVQARQNFTTIR